MKTNIPLLAVTLTLTVFLTSLVLETRDSGSNRARVPPPELDAVPAGGQFGIVDAGMLEPVLRQTSPDSCPSRVQEFLAEAKRFHDSGNSVGALELLRAVLILDTDHVQAIRAMGRILFADGQYEQAEPYLRRELQLSADPERLLRMRLGVAQMRQNKYGPALENLKIVLQHAPGDGAVHFALVCIYAEIGEQSRALYHLDQARTQLGATLLAHISDPHLDNLRHLRHFQRIVCSVSRRRESAPMSLPQTPPSR